MWAKADKEKARAAKAKAKAKVRQVKDKAKATKDKAKLKIVAAKAKAKADKEKSRTTKAQEHTFLDHAKSFDFKTCREMLEESPGLVNVQPAGRWSALHQAAEAGKPTAVKMLLSKGADLNLKTKDG